MELKQKYKKNFIKKKMRIEIQQIRNINKNKMTIFNLINQ